MKKKKLDYDDKNLTYYDEVDNEDENEYEKNLVDEFERKQRNNHKEYDEYLDCDEDDELLSGDDIETQDDFEAWQRFINGEG